MGDAMDAVEVGHDLVEVEDGAIAPARRAAISPCTSRTVVPAMEER